MLEQPGTCPVPAPIPLPHGERRVRIRYPAGFTALCQNDQAGVGDFWWMGRVLNISAQGRGVGPGKSDVPNPAREQQLMTELEGIVTSLRLIQ